MIPFENISGKQLAASPIKESPYLRNRNAIIHSSCKKDSLEDSEKLSSSPEIHKNLHPTGMPDAISKAL